jgi:putative membrane protein
MNTKAPPRTGSIDPMRRNAPRTPLIATIVITATVYGILGAALSSQPPEGLSPGIRRALGTFPLIIAIVNASALTCLLAGWRAIRAGRVSLHRGLMLAAMVLISIFLLLYVTRVSLGGVKAFPGPVSVRAYLYLPALVIHIILSILSVPLVVYNAFVGLTLPVGHIPRTPHPRVGRVAVVLWSVSLSLGILVYLLLNVLY